MSRWSLFLRCLCCARSLLPVPGKAKVVWANPCKRVANYFSILHIVTPFIFNFIIWHRHKPFWPWFIYLIITSSNWILLAEWLLCKYYHCCLILPLILLLLWDEQQNLIILFTSASLRIIATASIWSKLKVITRPHNSNCEEYATPCSRSNNKVKWICAVGVYNVCKHSGALYSTYTIMSWGLYKIISLCHSMKPLSYCWLTKDTSIIIIFIISHLQSMGHT